ncbi:MAG: TCR/Tet family MFS transporter, partial [Chloroflexi bacterium]|nr:TCR/Tet family MFS transporter [Chloroflexota bacterium]
FTNNDVASASTVYGLTVAVYALMQFIFAPILGSLSDRYGRRPVILISLLGAGIDYLIMAFAPSVEWLFVGRLISGISAANFTTVAAYIADVSPPEQRAKNFGMMGAAFGLGFIIGPAIGGVLGNVGLRVPFLVVAGFSLLNTLYGFFVLPESLKLEHRRAFAWSRANPIGSLRAIRAYPAVLSLAMIIVLSGLAQNALQSIWVLYTDFRFHWGPSEVGLSLAVVGLTSILMQGGLLGRIVSALGEYRTLLLGLAASVITYTLYGLAPQAWMFYVIPFLGAFGFIAGPSAQAIISKSIKPNEQGAVQGAVTSLISLTGVFGPVLSTNIFRYFISDGAPILLPGAPFFLGSALFLIGLVLALRSVSLQAQHRATTQPSTG